DLRSPRASSSHPLLGNVLSSTTARRELGGRWLASRVVSSPSCVTASAEHRALNERVLRICRALLALAAFTAIGYDVSAGPGVSDGDYFSYFTVLSNLFAAAMLLHGALRSAHERSRTVELLRGAAVVYILTTGVVYLLLLSG